MPYNDSLCAELTVTAIWLTALVLTVSVVWYMS